MAQTLEELVVEISADTRDLKKKLDNAEKNTNKFGKSLKGLGAIVGGAFAIGAIADFGKATIQAASDAEELENKFSVVFSNVREETDAWIDSYTQAVGRSKQATKGFLADQQDILTGLGLSQEEASGLSQNIVSLGIDLASFQNLSDEEALSRLGSALRGSSEAAAGFGADISVATLKQSEYYKSLGVGYEQMTQVEKIQLRLAVITEQSSNAIGDAERSSGGFANQLKRLQGTLKDSTAELGQNFLPTATGFVSFLNEEGIPWLIEFGKSIGEAFGEFVETAKPFIDDFMKIFMEILDNIKIFWDEWGDEIIRVLEGAFSILKNTFETSMRVIANIVKGVLQLLNGDFEGFNQTINTIFTDIFNFIKDIFEEIVDTIEDIDLFQIGADLLNGLIKGVKSVAGNLVDSVTQPVKDAVGNVKDYLGIRSPSRLFMGIGENVGEGFTQGIDKTVDTANKSIIDMVGPSASGQSISNVTNNVTRNPQVIVQNMTVRDESDIDSTSRRLFDLQDAADKSSGLLPLGV